VPDVAGLGIKFALAPLYPNLSVQELEGDMSTNDTPTDFSRTQAPREHWLARALPEEVIEPDLPIIDAHMHLWHHATGYRYFVEDMARDIAESGHNIVGTVFVECHSMYRAGGPAHLRPAGETEFAAGQGAIADSGKYTRSRIAAGIVGFADLTISDGLPELLDAHTAMGKGRFSGVRMRAKWDADPTVRGAVSADHPGLYLEPGFQAGLREVARRGLVFEASIYSPQIPDVTALARQIPEAKIVLIHTGSPVGHSSYRDRGAQVRANFDRDIRALAECPNVAVKLGGLLMPLAAFDFGRAERPASSDELAALWRPFIEPCLEYFGPDRCIASSNFPVDRAGFNYRALWNMFKRLTAGASDEAKSQIYRKTAERVYGL
jgi:predicted TIM-barrel fold metal-dependent hydrolase